MILATGARAREIPAAGLKADGKRIWTYRDAMTPPSWPESLLVFGSGAIGIEFASFYAAFGVKTTVVELLDRGNALFAAYDISESEAAESATTAVDELAAG